jgi:serine protease Do
MSRVHATAHWLTARLVVALAAASACREHQGPLDARGAAPATTAATPAATTASPSAAHTRVVYPAGPSSFVDLVDEARRGVVAIRATAPVKSGPAAMFPGAPDQVSDVALGTGFLVSAGGVFVLTNEHIADAAGELRVVLPDRSQVAARVVGRDRLLDVALLAIETPSIATLPLGSSGDLRVGEWLVVLGDAFGDEVTASAGIVSAVGRATVPALAPGGGTGFRAFLQTDARIHRGNSGGPVLDTSGQVVGIAVATGDRPGELSFVVPIDRVKEVIGQLRDTGEVAHGWIGAYVKPVTRELADQFGLPKPVGVVVTEVEAGPAARAGVRAGDVIVQWDHKDIDQATLQRLIGEAAIGRQVALGVWRSGAMIDLSLTTDRQPE